MTSISPYAVFEGNPISKSDELGDSSIIDNRGYMVHYNPQDEDLRVFMQNGENLVQIGELGKEINANVWFKNLAADNMREVKSLFSPWTFKSYVKQYGKWDYKYRSPANQNEDNSISDKYHILGIAFYRKDKVKGVGDLGETRFSLQYNYYEGELARAEDINNLHFGVVGAAFGFPETFMLKQAGQIEMQKRKEDFELGKVDSPFVPAEWRPRKTAYNYNGSKSRGPLLPPYGDNPADHFWIKKGFEYRMKNLKKLIFNER